MIFRYGKELMKKFGNVIYNYFLIGFRKIDKRYYIRGYGYGLVDLKSFCKECLNDSVLYEKAMKLKEAYGNDMDDLAMRILRYVHNRTKYIGDHIKWKTPEYWQTAKQTYDDKTGDCEDHAILILTLARLCGIPENRVFLCCGYMKSGGGHAYITYRSNDGIEYILDSTYYYDSGFIPNHKTYLGDERYMKPRWFFCNDSGAWK